MRYPRLTRIEVKGFRSLREVALDFGQITVVYGPRGAGKSNLVAVLSLLASLRTQSLGRFVAAAGGASALLYQGKEAAVEITADLTFAAAEGLENGYSATLRHAAGDRLFIQHDFVTSRRPGQAAPAVFGSGAPRGWETWSNRTVEQLGFKPMVLTTWRRVTSFTSGIAFTSLAALEELAGTLEPLLPPVVVAEEPAIGCGEPAETAERIRGIAARSQLVLTTRSPALAAEFGAGEVAVLERRDGETTVRRLAPADFAARFDKGRLSELAGVPTDRMAE